MEILVIIISYIWLVYTHGVSQDDRVRAIALAMGMVPILWTRTPSAGQFDTNGKPNYNPMNISSSALDWRVAGGLVSGTESYNNFQSILGNATALNTG